MILLKEGCFKDRIWKEPRKRTEEQLGLILNAVPSKREFWYFEKSADYGAGIFHVTFPEFSWNLQNQFILFVLTFFLPCNRLDIHILSPERYVPNYKWGNWKVLVKLISLVRVTQQPKAQSAVVTLIKEEFGDWRAALYEFLFGCQLAFH